MTGDLVPERRDLRVSHDDRERTAERLRVAAGDGRLTAEELDQRLEAALTARTYGDLEKLVTDLPAAPAGAAGLGSAAKDLVRLRARSGHITRDGEWAVPRRMEIDVRSGHVSLDFTRAVITYPTLDLALVARSGHVRLIVPPGVTVDVDAVEMRSGHVRQRVRPQPGTPVHLAVTVSGEVRSGHVDVRGPRRSFWDWLMRRPLAVRPR